MTIVLEVLFACSAVICIVFRGGHQDVPRLIQDLFGLSIVAALGTSLALCYLFEHASFFGENPLLCALGRHSLEIYVTHTLFTAGCRIAFLKMGLENIYISLIFNLMVSTSMPVFIAVLCEKLGIYDLFFRPYTYIRSHLGKR